MIASRSPDIVILDIQMAGASGLRVCETIPSSLRPAIIFATAHRDFALDAFALGVTDYLLKPFALARLDDAIARGRGHCDRRAEERDRELAAGPGGAERLNALWCFDRGRRHRVPVGEILWIGGERDYARLHILHRTYLWRGALGSLGAALDPAVFVRVHRSAIVRVSAISEFRATRSGGLQLKVANSLVPVSRQHAPALRALLLRA